MPDSAGLSLKQQKLVSGARVLGASTALPVYLEDSELARLTAIIVNDLGEQLNSVLPPSVLQEAEDYYSLPLSWFEKPLDIPTFAEVFLAAVQEIQDFETYFECLCEVHKRRKKYERVMATQPLPEPVQISPRALLEFGLIASPALSSWLTWRKWFYDIDNRSAQETGYLFEPILASALGGDSYGAKNSPVKSRGNPDKGRQVDCIVNRDAYEFKLRVTIAASGQGRFGEELDFAADCRASGFKPTLLVLDPTPSARLTDLADEYRQHGGAAYVGSEAWQHLEDRAGPTMSRFVEKYVRQPIENLDQYSSNLLDLQVSASSDRRSFKLSMNDDKQAFEWELHRDVPERGDRET